MLPHLLPLVAGVNGNERRRATGQVLIFLDRARKPFDYEGFWWSPTDGTVTDNRKVRR